MLICRCTGYVKILDASSRAGETPVAITEGGVGGRAVKYEVRSSLGDRGFIDDMEPEGLHGAVVLSEHARADIMAIDPADALACLPVVAVLADDVPGELRSG